ncbi:peptidase family t4 protein [Cystoisospora suis]|uniref:Peptidase family t4 protein n=1 Tax=Cystoisospora suis TaxID=483139 RepID=A0A2C6L3E9_9APIC|nr:peptidase family t4 protein [Cystoisospora suis]
MWVGSGLSFLCHVERSRKRPKEESDLQKDVAGASFFAFDRPLKAAGRLFGAAPATRDFDVLQAGNTVESIHGLFFGGRSVFGLDAVGGLLAFQRERGIGVSTEAGAIPVCPAACIFDLASKETSPEVPPPDDFPVLSPQDIRRACLEAQRLNGTKETLGSSSDTQSRPIRLRCVLGEDNEAVEIQQCECEDNRGTEPNQKRRSLSAGCSTSQASSSFLPVPPSSWLGSIGAGVRARCGGLRRPGCFQDPQGGWGEARQQRTWPGHEESQATLLVEVYAVVNCFGDVIPNVRGGEHQASFKETELTHSTARLLRESDPDELMARITPENTTLVAVFTNAVLDKVALHRICTMTATGIARAIRPAFTPVDGDLVVALSTGELQTHGKKLIAEIIVGSMAAECAEKAIQNAVAASNARPRAA